MNQQKTPDRQHGWKRMCFKHNKVWVATDRHDRPRVEKGKVLIKYQLDQRHEYRVNPESITPLPSEGGCKRDSSAAKDADKKASQLPADDAERIGPPPGRAEAVHVYTDGASSGNPGPAGIGVFLCFGAHEKEISRYIGISTNNIAELEAIRVGLSEIKNPQLPVRLYTDSSYALGLLTQGWKPKKNQDLIASIKKLMRKFKDLQFVKVRGHAGDAGNEKADQLATGAVKSR